MQPKNIQFRRFFNTENHLAFIGPQGSLSVLMTDNKKQLFIHDGTTAGGHAVTPDFSSNETISSLIESSAFQQELLAFLAEALNLDDVLYRTDNIDCGVII